VDSASKFNRAVLAAQPGDVIELGATDFPQLHISGLHSDGAPVQIIGQPGTQVAGFQLEDVSNISIQSLVIRPNARNNGGVTLNIAAADSIVVQDVTFDGVDLHHGARVNIGADTSNITVSGSSFTECGVGKWCIQPSGTHILIQGNTFTNCESCDPIHGG